MPLGQKPTIVMEQPIRGVIRSESREQPEPQSLISSLNVLPYDANSGFRRLAQRPGTAAFGSTTDNPVQGMIPIGFIIQPGGVILPAPSVVFPINSTSTVGGETIYFGAIPYTTVTFNTPGPILFSGAGYGQINAYEGSDFIGGCSATLYDGSHHQVAELLLSISEWNVTTQTAGVSASVQFSTGALSSTVSATPDTQSTAGNAWFQFGQSFPLSISINPNLFVNNITMTAGSNTLTTTYGQLSGINDNGMYAVVTSWDHVVSGSTLSIGGFG